MNKAILILNKMPKSCADCPVCAWSEITGLYNCLNGTKEEKCVDEYLLDDRLNKPSWCPLKPLPEKMKVDYDTITSAEVTEKVVAMGYNFCIDTILGEKK